MEIGTAAASTADLDELGSSLLGKRGAITEILRGIGALPADDRPKIGVEVADIAGPKEARGADIDGTRVHSIRQPSFVVSTEVIFGLPEQRLSIRFDAGSSPAPYVDGTLLAARAVIKEKGLIRGLDTLLLQ